MALVICETAGTDPKDAGTDPKEYLKSTSESESLIADCGLWIVDF